MKTKKIMSLLLATVMAAGLVSGCSKNASNEAATEQSKKTQVQETQGDAQTTGAAGTAEAITLPLVNEPTTLTVYMAMDGTFGVFSKDYNDSEFFKEMEKRTGVHIEFITPAEGEETNTFNLMFTSGELPDIITMADSYTSGGLAGGIEDGYYLDLTPYLDSCLPDYNAVRSQSEELLRDTTMDNGTVGAVYEIRTKKEGPWCGYQVRQDWLDDLGIDTPVTYDDWEDMLTKFKEEKGAYAPLALTGSGYDMFDVLSSGFGAGYKFLNKDGTVIYSPITENWRDYLRKMNDWYNKGLINPDFMTASPYFGDQELVTSNQTGIWFSMAKLTSAYEASNSDINIVAIPNPVLKEGDVTHTRCADSLVSSLPAAISTDCENPELALKWLNYLYTQEGSMLASYGVENVSYTVDASGEVAFTDLVNNNPDGHDPVTQMVIQALVPSKIPSLYHFDREYLNMREKDIESYSIWGSDTELDDWVMPSFITLSVEETSEYASIFNDVSSYMNECTLKFITGEMDVNGSDWDTYVATIEGMGIDRCTEIQQNALDRYNAR